MSHLLFIVIIVSTGAVTSQPSALSCVNILPYRTPTLPHTPPQKHHTLLCKLPTSIPPQSVLYLPQKWQLQPELTTRAVTTFAFGSKSEREGGCRTKQKTILGYDIHLVMTIATPLYSSYRLIARCKREQQGLISGWGTCPCSVSKTVLYPPSWIQGSLRYKTWARPSCTD